MILWGSKGKAHLTSVMIYKQYICLDRVQESMRELDVLKDKRDVNLCSTMALILAHKKGRSIGKLETINSF